MNLAVAVIPFILLPFFGFSQYTDELKWLQGNWVMESEVTTIESWSIKDDSTLVGYSVILENGNETFSIGFFCNSPGFFAVGDTVL